MRSGCPSVLTPSNIYSPESTSTLPDASTRRDFNVIERLGTYLKSSEKKFRIASRPRTGSRPSGISTASWVYSAAKPSKFAVGNSHQRGALPFQDFYQRSLAKGI